MQQIIPKKKKKLSPNESNDMNFFFNHVTFVVDKQSISQNERQGNNEIEDELVCQIVDWEKIWRFIVHGLSSWPSNGSQEPKNMCKIRIKEKGEVKS